MLPFVLGGIALAAVGYGVKEICETEGCPWEGSGDSEESRQRCDVERINQLRNSIASTGLPKCREKLALSQDNESRKPKDLKAPSTCTDELHYLMLRYEKALEDASIYSRYLLTDLDGEDETAREEALRLYKVLSALLRLRLYDKEGIKLSVYKKLRKLERLLGKIEAKSVKKRKSSLLLSFYDISSIQ